MRFILILALAVFASPSLAKPKSDSRGPASVACLALFKECVAETDRDRQSEICANSAKACASRLPNKDEYSRLEKKCAEREQQEARYAKAAANFCRAVLTQYLLFGN